MNEKTGKNATVKSHDNLKTTTNISAIKEQALAADEVKLEEKNKPNSLKKQQNCCKCVIF